MRVNFKDVTVRLVATAEEAGEVTYLYQQLPVVSLGYAPNSESVELDLGGMKAAIDGISNLINSDEGQITSPNEMKGSFRFTATETSSVEGQEAGSISYAVAKPIKIASTDDEGVESSLSMQTGTLFSISGDAETGVGSMSFDIGAISAAAPSDSGFAQMNLSGFTGQADVNPVFGFTVTEGSDLEPGELIIDGNMNLAVVFNEFAENEYVDGVVAMALNMMAPNGTSFSRAGNGTTQISGAGPFTVSFAQTPDIGNPTVEIVMSRPSNQRH